MGSEAERFLIWGGGGHGKVVADLVFALGHQVVGFIDSNPKPTVLSASEYSQITIIAEDELHTSLRGGELPLRAEAIALGIGDNLHRRRCFDVIQRVSLPPLVHPSAVVSPSATIGPGTVVFPGVVVNASATIGAGVILNTASLVEHDCDVGSGVHLSPGVILCGEVRIGPYAWIGAGAVITPGLSVGANAVIGAGAVVLKAVRENSTVVGNPAREIASRAD